MASTFRAILKRRTSDKDGAGTVTFDYPASEITEVDAVGKMVNEVLYVTVMREQECQPLTPTDEPMMEAAG